MADEEREAGGVDATTLQAAPANVPADPGSAADSEAQAFRGMGVVFDIPVRLSVEVGRAEMLVREVLQLSEGSVVEIDRAAGEPADLYVNGRLVGRGDLIVVDDKIAIRITELGSLGKAAEGG